MAVTVTPNLTDINDVEDTTDWSSGTWGAAGTELLADVDIYIQGAQSGSEKITKNNTDWIMYIYPTGSADMSAVDTHLFWWLKSDIVGFTTTMTIRIGDGTNWKEWTVDRGSWEGEWKCFVQDVAATPTANSGTTSMSAITEIGVLYTTIGDNFRAIENCWVDVARFGTGLTAYGTDFDFTDIATDDAVGNNKYGVIQTVDGINFVQGRLLIDDNDTTATLNSGNEVLAYRDLAVSANLYSITFTGAALTANMVNLSVISSGVNDDTRPEFDCTGNVGTLSVDGGSFSRMGTLGFKDGQDLLNCKFSDAYEIDTSTANVYFCTFASSAETSNAAGAVIYYENYTFTSPTFLNNHIGINMVDANTYNFNGWNFAGNDYDILNSSNATIIINSTGSTVSNYFNGGTGATTTIQSLVEFTVTNIIDGTEVRILRVSDNVELAGAENVGASPSGLNNISVSADPDNAGRYVATYAFSGGSDVPVNVYALNLDYLWIGISATLKNENGSLQIAQTGDRQYI